MALKTITSPGGDLFSVAAQYLNDATQWNLIAAANNMVDPFFTGPKTLVIPAADPNGGNGGILE